MSNEKMDWVKGSQEVLEAFNDWPNDAGFEVVHEERSPIELPIQGSIPTYAAGVLYRQGPRGHKIDGTPNGTFHIQHWFDGLQQTHRFLLLPDADGNMKVMYNSRFASDGILEEIRKTGKWDAFTFGQKRDPCISFFGKVMSSFTAMKVETRDRSDQPPQNENVCVTLSVNMPGLPTIIESGGQDLNTSNAAVPVPNHASGIRSLWAKTDNSYFKQIDPTNLEPIGLAKQSVLHPLLKGPLSSAHAKTDPVTGDLYNYNLEFTGRHSTYRVFHVSASTGKTDILATLSGPGIAPAYLHSLFLTPDYVILCIWSSHLAQYGAKVLWERNILDAIVPFSTTNTTKWFVISRYGEHGLMAEFESPAMFAFHTVNAWQDPKTNDVFCDIVDYANLDTLHRTYYEAMKSTSPKAHEFVRTRESAEPRLRRYKLSAAHISSTTIDRAKRAKSKQPLPQAEVETEIRGSQGIGDLPTINPKFSLRKQRYVYSIPDRGLSTFFDGLSKADLETGEVQFWDNPKGHTPSEAIFVPRPGGEEEDDGVLLSVVLDGFAGKSYLLCLDASTMKEVGRAEVGCAVGFGFHGAYVGNGGLENST